MALEATDLRTRIDEMITETDKLNPIMDEWVVNLIKSGEEFRNKLIKSAKKKDKEALAEELSGTPFIESLGAVIYTDGGCRPTSRGIGGWGIHGYIYLNEEPKQGHGCRDKNTAMGYAASGCKPVTVVKYIDGCGSLVPESTNNEAEIVALLQALKIATRTGVRNLHLILDSKYALQGATEWLTKWKNNNWYRSDGNEVTNVSVWKEIDQYLQGLASLETTITWQWVKGHSDSLGNTVADGNASRGVIAGLKGKKLSDLRLSEPKTYWKADPDRHAFISEPHWFFFTKSKAIQNLDDGYFAYYHGKYEDIDQVGKRISDRCYSVAHLQKPCNALEMIRDYQNFICHSHYDIPVVAAIQNVFNPRVYNDLNESDNMYIRADGPKDELFAYDNTPLTEVLKPANQAFNAFLEMDLLHDMLGRYRRGDLTGYTLTDITDIIYEAVESKNKTTRKFKLENDATSLKVDVNYDVGNGIKQSRLALTLGIDLPRRNTLSALADSDAKIHVITWKESNIAFRYAIIIQAGNDFGIWAGVYSNIKLLT